MASTAQIQAMIDSIEAAIIGNPGGIKVTEYRGRRVERMSTSELMNARAQLQAELARSRTGSMFNVASFGRSGR